MNRDADSIERDIEQIADDLQFAISYATDQKTAQHITQILSILNSWLAHVGGPFEDIQARFQALRERLTRLYEYTVDADIARMVQAVLDQTGDLYIAQDNDTGDVMASSWTKDKKIESLSGETLHEALSSFQGFQSKKKCNKCGIIKRLSEYSFNRNNSDGHVARCKSCERERVAQYDRTKREKAKLEDTETKKCKRCGKHRRLKYFWSTGEGRRRAHCVDCMRILRKEGGGGCGI